MNDDKVKGYEWMWTTHKEEFFLFQSDNPIRYGIVRVFTNSGTRIITSFSIEDNDVHIVVGQKLKDAGVPVLDGVGLRRLMDR